MTAPAGPPEQPLPAAVERPQAIARQRLHPLSPVLKSVRTLFLVVAAVSWRGLQNLGPDLYALVLLGLLVLVLLYSAVAWRFTGYEVVGRELRIHEGCCSGAPARCRWNGSRRSRWCSRCWPAWPGSPN
ncbi:hypothetical protein ACFQZ4_13260 [Catellatospora coxensis]